LPVAGGMDMSLLHKERGKERGSHHPGLAVLRLRWKGEG
jgi:hypothetical protein